MVITMQWCWRIVSLVTVVRSSWFTVLTARLGWPKVSMVTPMRLDWSTVSMVTMMCSSADSVFPLFPHRIFQEKKCLLEIVLAFFSLFLHCDVCEQWDTLAGISGPSNDTWVPDKQKLYVHFVFTNVATQALNAILGRGMCVWRTGLAAFCSERYSICDMPDSAFYTIIVIISLFTVLEMDGMRGFVHARPVLWH